MIMKLFVFIQGLKIPHNDANIKFLFLSLNSQSVFGLRPIIFENLEKKLTWSKDPIFMLRMAQQKSHFSQVGNRRYKLS